MVQTALDLVSQALSAVLGLALPLLIGVAVLALLLLLFALYDRGRVRDATRRAGRRGLLLGRWVAALLALLAGTLLVSVAHRSVEARFGSQINARYTNTADPNTSPTVQQAPHATYLAERTYTRTLVIPPELLRQVRQEGVQVLAPYLQDPTSDNVVRLRDRFTRSGQDVVFSREATLQTEQDVTLAESKVLADLKFVDAAGGHQGYYNATFDAQYTFANPLATPATMRFAFPLPNGSGTLSGFAVTVDGQPYRTADLSSGGSVWEGVVQPGASVSVRVTYRHQGSKGWSYDLSARREPVRTFDLTIRTDQPAKFQRYSLFPTATTGSAFGGQTTLRWQLQNAITAQSVAVVFAQGSVRETLTKIYSFTPLSLVLGTLLLLVWASLFRLPLPPLRLALAEVGLSLGFAFGGVLTGYLPPLPALLLGAALGLGLALLALGGRFWLPLLLTVLAPLTFLSVGNAGLLLGLLAVVALLPLLRARAARSTPPRTVNPPPGPASP